MLYKWNKLTKSLTINMNKYQNHSSEQNKSWFLNDLMTFV